MIYMKIAICDDERIFTDIFREKLEMTAEKCGFSDYTTFIRAFRRSIGMSPGSYQKMLKK